MGRGDSFELQGLNGGQVINASSGNILRAECWRWIQVANDAVFTALNGPASDGSTLDDLELLTTPIELPAGFGFGGKFNSIELSQGVVIAYYW